MQETKMGNTDKSVIDQTCMVFGQMNEPPGARLRVALSAPAMAEYFRDTTGTDTLLFVGNIFRFSQAGFRSICSSRSYAGECGQLSTDSGHRNGCVTRNISHRPIKVRSPRYKPFTFLLTIQLDPAPATAFGNLDAFLYPGTFENSEKGIYPAVDPLASSSRILDHNTSVKSTTLLLCRVQRTLQRYRRTAQALSRFSVLMN